MEKEKILKEIEERFNKMKSEFKMNVTLDELDTVYSVRDSILKDGFVSENFVRQLCYRIVEMLMRWNEYLHSLVMPNPQNMLNMSESKVLNQDERKEITETMKRIMDISSTNSLLILKKDKAGEAKFIDDAVGIWENEFKEKFTNMMQKIHNEWKGDMSK